MWLQPGGDRELFEIALHDGKPPGEWTIARLKTLIGAHKAKVVVVLSFMKDSGATISSADHMINKSSLLPAQDTRHGRVYHTAACDGNGKK